MKKISCVATAFCFLFLLPAIPIFGQETYVLPKPCAAASLVVAIKAQAKVFPGIQVEASQFVPGTNIPAGILEVTFKFAKPAEEGEGILEPWLVALLPTDEEALVSEFVVQERFTGDYIENYGLRGDARVHSYLEKFLEAVYIRLDQPAGP